MPGTPADRAKGDHSTIANVQYLSAHTGAFVVAATRNGIEENPLTHQRLYYNGGSSIWDPESHKLAQAAVLPPEVLPSGVHGVAIADIEPAKVRTDPGRACRASTGGVVWLAGIASRADRRQRQHGVASRHDLRHGWRSGQAGRCASVWSPPSKGGLAVLPALFRYGPNRTGDDYQRLAEPQGGASEMMLADLARLGRGLCGGKLSGTRR